MVFLACIIVFSNVSPLKAVASSPVDENFESYSHSGNTTNSRTLGSLIYSSNGTSQVDIIDDTDAFLGEHIDGFDDHSVINDFKWDASDSITYFEFASADLSNDFRLVSLNANVVDQDSAQVYEITGYNGGSGMSPVVTVSGFDFGTSGDYGSGSSAITYTKEPSVYRAGALSFGSDWDHIDTVRFTRTDNTGSGVTMIIDNIDFENPTSGPVFTSSATATFAENASGTVYSAVATGTGTITYSLTGGADQSKFNINSSTGALTFKGAPDYETPTDAGTNNVYDVIITATDNNGSSIHNVAVTVTGVNDVNFSTADNASIVNNVLTKTVTAGNTADISLYPEDLVTGYLSVYAPNENAGFPGGIYAYSGIGSTVTLYITAESGYTFDLSSFKFAADKTTWNMSSVDVSFTSGGVPHNDSYAVNQDGTLGYSIVNSFTNAVNDVTQVILTVSGYTEFQDIEITDIKPVADSTAPVFDITPNVSNVAATAFDLSASIDEAGKIYYVVVGDGQTAPTAAQVKSGVTYSGVSILASGSNIVGSGPYSHTFNVSGLTSGTAYDVYAVAEDDEGLPNLQGAPVKLDVSTLVVQAAPVASSVSISGTAQVGQTLTGSYTYNDANTDLEGTSTFKWYRADDTSGTNKAAISGATSSTYTLQADDLAKFISFEVTPVAQTGTTTGTPVESARTAVVVAGEAAPVASSVSISGTAQVGQTLTGSYTYSDANTDQEGTSTFKWYRADDISGTNKTAIAGATSSTYTLQTVDLAKFISFEVTPVAQTGTTTGTPVESAR
ncbi:hypothetical protein, partial [Paenibacillus sp. sgz500958]|uniref:hypothetical protein n=1 Tax=Paenibacillus sp. sgz500958 TaxID=3242475 RepID=UPI0036D2F1D0